MTAGTVETVNESRGVFAVHCDEGRYAYFRVSPENMPGVGDRVECDEAEKPFPKLLKNRSRGTTLSVLSGIVGLPRDVAAALTG